MIWEKTLELLRNELSSSVYKLWIEPLRCMEVREDAIRLLSPGRCCSAYISRNFLPTIEQKIFETGSVKRRVLLCEGDSETKVNS